MISKLKQWLESKFLRSISGKNRFPSEDKFRVGDVVQHVKSRKVYRIMLCPERLTLEATMTPAYAYECANKQDNAAYRIWVRPQAEMEDGRFELILKFDENEPRN